MTLTEKQIQTKWDIFLIKMYFEHSNWSSAYNSRKFLDKLGIPCFGEQHLKIRRMPQLAAKYGKDFVGFIISEMPTLYAYLQGKDDTDMFSILDFMKDLDAKWVDGSKYLHLTKKDKAEQRLVVIEVAIMRDHIQKCNKQTGCWTTVK